MKKLIAIWLCLALVLCACNKTENIDESQNVTPTVAVTPTVVPTTGAEGESESDLEHVEEVEGEVPEFEGLDDPEIPTYLEEEIYASLTAELGEGEYTIESVDAVWLSKEYLEESAYNQLENIYFGYYLSDVEEDFGGMNYVFTLDENGQTTVEEFEEYEGFINENIVPIAVVGGIILVTVVVVCNWGTIKLTVTTAVKNTSKLVFLTKGCEYLTKAIVVGVQSGDVEQAVKSIENALAQDVVKLALIKAIPVKS